MLMIKVPESVSEYFSNMAVRTAVDLLLPYKQAEKIDKNYTWQELRQFYQAYLSAHICRYSFIEMMLDIRDLLFLDNPEFEISSTIEETYYDDDDGIFKGEGIWESGEVFTYFVHSDSKLGFMASIIVEKGKLSLQIMSCDEKVVEHQKTIFGKTWPEEIVVVDDDGKYWFSTDHNLLGSMEKWKDKIDIMPIKKALDDFINNLKTFEK